MSLILSIGVLSALLSLSIDVMMGTWLMSAGIVPILGDIVRLQLSYNAGIAFSIHLPSPWQELLIGSALCAVILVAIRSVHTRVSGIGFGLIFGGATANLIDRTLHGAVTDFISVGTFPIFNAADSCITIGAGLLLLEAWIHRKKQLKS